MKNLWILLALLPGIPLRAWQAATPQAALEEIATTTKPEVIARHLPEPVQKSIAVLPKLQKQQVMAKLLELKASQLDDCTIRPGHDADAWEIVNGDGETKGTVRLANAFISGVDAILPLRIETDSVSQMFIVTMHLEDSEWRIDDFGPWEKNDLGLAKLVHQTTEMEKNEAAARQTMQKIGQAVRNYAYWNPETGFPFHLRVLTERMELGQGRPPLSLLDESFKSEPLIKDGYQFRYLLTEVGTGEQGEFGNFELTAVPLEFGKTGAKSYFANTSGIHATTENRAATEADPRADE
jgi:hypothetical protein